MSKFNKFLKTHVALTAMAMATLSVGVKADFVINDDLIVDGSACVGFDCVNGESFGFDTIRVKENNLRIKFDDTSVAASFPRNDWQITANDSANGGASKFSIDDISGGATPFTIEAGARSHSLYVDDGGRIGIRTSTPAVELHIIDGDTPTLRLQQDGSSGFAPQTWDVAGNETNFFVRDVTNGSTLPFRIRPGAPSSSIFIDVDGDVGLGTTSPASALHVLVNEGADSTMLTLENNGGARILFEDNAGEDGDWLIASSADELRFTETGSGVTEMVLQSSTGNMTISGTLTTGSATVYPDYVFEPDYKLLPIADLETYIQKNKHLPNIPSATEIAENGLNLTEMHIKLIEKVEELALYTIQQEKAIRQQGKVISKLKTELEQRKAL